MSLDEQAIFEAARRLEAPEAREAYLQQICAEDAAIGQRVRALLRALEQNASFLEAPAPVLAHTVDEPFRERPGAVIGPYKLLEQIGEGGFGVVFMAEQTDPVRRKVALKVLKPGMDTRQVVARFEAERQALAIMDHPNIAKVFDGGATASGRSYFVMELVKGTPITEFCDQSRLSVRERLELFVCVCHAVQHAHQKGIIHRDLKPSNVLVTVHDITPVVKVIDFGVAKALGQELTDKTLFTGFAQIIGTPLYMSPEQAGESGLDVDTRSDIYSVGVLLYELLTGTTPFEKERFKEASYDEIRRIIREEEPPRPSTRVSHTWRIEGTAQSAENKTSNRRGASRSTLRALRFQELDWIAMKALEKDRSRRYETASAFAADVQRYLNDEAVQACPPSRWYRLRKLARRHKAALYTATAMAAAVLIAIASLISAVTVLAESNIEVKEEQEQTKKALKGEKEANDNLRQAVAREQRSLAFHRIALAARELEAGNVGRAEELLTECPEKLRGWEWHYLKRLPHDKPRVLYPGKARPLWGLAYSADGRYLAIGIRVTSSCWNRPPGKCWTPCAGTAGRSPSVRKAANWPCAAQATTSLCGTWPRARRRTPCVSLGGP
jgi:serine/threonine protein kinase